MWRRLQVGRKTETNISMKSKLKKLKSVAQVWNRLNSMKNYKGIEWNSDDLQSSKQAVRCLLNEGISEEEILTLDFGNLDVAGVLEELR